MLQRLKTTCSMVILAGVVLAFTGCQKPPEKKFAEAKDACSNALQMEADRFAPEQYTEATTLFEEAKAELTRQKKKLFFMRDFKPLEQKLSEVVILANKAGEAAKIEKERQAAAMKAALEAEKAKKKKKAAPRAKK